MEKDNIIKNFSKFFRLLNFNLLLSKLIAHIHFLDPKENTKQRVVSALILMPIAIYAIFYSKDFFIFLAIIIAIIMASEWTEMISKMKDHRRWQIIGLLYISIPIFLVIKIRFHGSEILFWMFAVIWSTDIFAFFAGKNLGGPKLAPKISPNKTWSGLLGGIVASAVIGFLSSFMFSGGVIFFILISILLAIIEQLSDLLESKFKRIFGVKDSGNIIPGHGGVLDRLDGMMLVAPALFALITFFPNKFIS